MKFVTIPTQVKKLKVTAQSDSTLTLGWNKISRVSGYRVYIYNETTKKYEYKGQTSKNTIKITGLTQAKKYKIKVRAYKTLDNTKYFGRQGWIL